jgi:hypothetical protein
MEIEDERNSFPGQLNGHRAVREAEIARLSKEIREGTSLAFAEYYELIGRRNVSSQVSNFPLNFVIQRPFCFLIHRQILPQIPDWQERMNETIFQPNLTYIKL